MNPGLRYVWGGILLVFVSAVSMIGREVRQSQRAAVSLTLAAQRKEQARHLVKLAEQMHARAERESAAHAAVASAAAAPIAATATAGAVSRAAGAEVTMTLNERDGKIRPEVAVAIHPELRALHLQIFDDEFAGIWGPLLQRLNLSEEKTAALKALLRAHEERRLDVTAVAGEQQLELGDPAIQKMRSADGALLEKQTFELLGVEDGKIYQQFRRDRALQTTITDLAVANFQTSTPLTFAESQQLLTILSANSERIANGFVRPDTVNWAVALGQVERDGTFSPASIKEFRRLVAERQLNQQIGLRWDEIENWIVGPIRGPGLEGWMPSFPALQPKPWTGAATINKPH